MSLENQNPTPEMFIPPSPEVELALVPNPHLVSPEVVAQLSPENLQLTAEADRILRLPGERQAAVDRRERANPGQFDDDKVFFNEVGFDAYVASIKMVRHLAGEDNFNGIDPIDLSSQERTSLGDYLQHASDGKLVFSDWMNHDRDNHLMGALLASDEVADLTRTAATTVIDGSPEDQKAIGDAIDVATYQINHMWRNPQMEVTEITALTKALTTMIEVGVLKDLDQEDALHIANSQYQFIKKLTNTPVFIDAKYAQPRQLLAA